MKDIHISLPDEEYPFFMKLLKELNFVTIKESIDEPPTKDQFLDGLREAIEEVNDI